MHPRLALAIVFALLLPLLPAFAHDPGISFAQIEVLPDRVQLTLTVGAADAAVLQEELARAGKLKKPAASLEVTIEEIAQRLGELRRGKTVLSAETVSPIETGEPGEIALRVVYELPAGDRFEYRAAGLEFLPQWHRQLAVATRGADTLAESILDRKNNVLAVPLK